MIKQLRKENSFFCHSGLDPESINEFLEDVYGHEVIEQRQGEPVMSKEAFLKGLKDDNCWK